MVSKRRQEETFQVHGFVISDKSKGSSFVKTLDEIITETKTINTLQERINNLERQAKEISSSISMAEKRQDKAVSFMMWVAGIIVVAFFLSLIPLLFDYYKDNSDRYEKFTKRIDNLNTRVDILEKK